MLRGDSMPSDSAIKSSVNQGTNGAPSNGPQDPAGLSEALRLLLLITH
jgi:hypothetical protein